ncbi:DNA-binding response regulator [Alicyclobacillaceae bacterium I2511]|nr:DNA-binding response regulator [Alicyclobacillaceae bacterium I2511]
MESKDETLIRIGIADDNEPFRETLSEILAFEPDFQVVGLWRHGAEALVGLGRVKPDVVLVDINMPMLNGVDLTKRAREKFPHIKVIILSMHDDEGYVLETLKAGAAGYLIKDGSGTEVVRAIREVAAGRAYVHPQVTRTVISQFRDKAKLEDTWRGLLTQREMDVLRQLWMGKANDEIAQSLNITTKTVKNHISSILTKLDVGDRTQAVVCAMRRHWLPL